MTREGKHVTLGLTLLCRYYIQTMTRENKHVTLGLTLLCRYVQ